MHTCYPSARDLSFIIRHRQSHRHSPGDTTELALVATAIAIGTEMRERCSKRNSKNAHVGIYVTSNTVCLPRSLTIRHEMTLNMRIFNTPFTFSAFEISGFPLTSVLCRFLAPPSRRVLFAKYQRPLAISQSTNEALPLHIESRERSKERRSVKTPGPPQHVTFFHSTSAN